MFKLLLGAIFLAAAAAAYCLVFSFLPVASGRAVKALIRLRRGRLSGRSGAAGTSGRTAGDAAGAPRFVSERGAVRGGALGRFIAARIPMSAARREAVDNKLGRAGYRLKAGEFYADIIIRLSPFVLAVPALYSLGMKTVAFCTAALCVGLYYKWAGEPDERLKRASALIADELPRFVSMINYSMTTDRDLTRAIERYLKIAKPAFRYDLELLLLEMKAGNTAEALRRFDLRVGISQLSAFVSGLIDAGRGVDQKTFFYLMEENMKQLFIENRKRELARRPAKVKRAIIAVGLCMFILYLVPICSQLADGFEMFR